MKLKNKLLLDSVMFILILVCMEYHFTGGVLHEILGIALILTFIFHSLILNGKYYRAMSKQLVSGKISNGKGKLSFSINVLLLIATVVMLISSLAISRSLFTFISKHINHYFIWRNLHILSSVCILICIFIHVILHEKLVMNSILKLMKKEETKKSVPVFSRIIAVLLAVIIIKISLDNVAIIVEDDSTKNQKRKGNSHYERMEGQAYQPITESVDQTSDNNQTQVTTNQANDVPSLQDYLNGLFCNGCGKHCSLASPRCGKGQEKAQTAEQEYYVQYRDSEIDD